MAYSLDTPYYFTSHSGTGKCLNVYGNEQVSNNRNVCLWTKDTGTAQSWSIKQFSGGLKIVSNLNQSYALNYYWSSGQGNAGNCDIYPQEGNDTDSCVTVLTMSGTNEIYKFKLKNYNLYLTATGTTDNADVRWEPLANSGTAQLWKLSAFGAAGEDSEDSTGERILTMPTGLRCNWNQKHSGITSLFGGSACTLVAGLDMANFYATNGTGYTPADMNSSVYWGSSGYTWKVPGSGKFTGQYYRHQDGYSQTELRAKIKEQIDAGHPPVIDMDLDPTHSHTVFCYGYKNGAATDADILVYDPANLDTSNIEGRNTNLAESMVYNGHEYIRNVRLTSTD